MKADAPLFLSHFFLIVILASTDIFYLIWLTDPKFDFKQENRVEMAVVILKCCCNLFLLMILHKFGSKAYEGGVEGIDLEKNFLEAHSFSFL